MLYKYDIMSQAASGQVPIIQAISIGQVLRQRRKSMGLTQDQVAKVFGVRRQTIADLEAGKNVGSHLLLKAMDYFQFRFDLPAQTAYEIGKKKSIRLVKEAVVPFEVSDKFDFPYDWSNPGHLSDDVLIMKVLKGLRFADIVRLCKRFGVERIDDEIKSSFYDEMREDLIEIMDVIHEAINKKVA